MAYNELLADRIRQVLKGQHIGFEEKKMMGGLTFMVNGKMCIGIVKEDLMARVGKAFHKEALKQTGARPMDFTGKPMNGYVFVSPNGTDLDDQLTFWIEKSLIFNKTLV